jgi:hypothetical protein
MSAGAWSADYCWPSVLPKAACGAIPKPSAQFRRVIGYRDLGKLAVAVEREVGAASPPSLTTEEARETVTV